MRKKDEIVNAIVGDSIKLVVNSLLIEVDGSPS